MNSSSGGVFLPLAREVINKGGVVFGAVYDDSWEVHHVYAEKIEDVYPMMGSKYLQSKIENSYKDAERFLKQGREVMFVSSPCQIAGLRTFFAIKSIPICWLLISYVMEFQAQVFGEDIWQRLMEDMLPENRVAFRRPLEKFRFAFFSKRNVPHRGH